MKFNLLEVLTYFAVQDDRLVRRLASGSVKAVTLVDRGRLAVVLNGKRLYGPEVAYACLYGAVPMYPIVQLDGDPLNMSPENLFPARLKRLRYRCVALPGGFRHPLSAVAFPFEEECRQDWLRMAREYYKRDKPLVRMQEDQARGPVVIPPRIDVVRKQYARSSKRSRPEPVAGQQWHWYAGQWVLVPEPVHVSDDWMMRCSAVLRGGAVSFVFDPVLQKTLPVTSDQPGAAQFPPAAAGPC